MIDTHIHLQDPVYEQDLDAVLRRAAEAGVNLAIVPGSDVMDSGAALELVARQAEGPCQLYAAVGVHPTNAQRLDDDGLAALRHLAHRPETVAIGEIGLDYYWPKIKDRGWPCASPEVQREALAAQLRLASEMKLPVIIHDREAHEDTLAILRAWRSTDSSASGVLHAYDGGPEYLRDVLDLGLYIGIGGPITYRTSTALREAVRQAPLSRLLLETDGPYRSPQPYRGKRNEPSYVSLIAAKIAQIRDIPLGTVTQATTANARELFSL